MKKKIITGIAAMVFAVALTLNVSISMSNDGNVNDVTFSNIEALADENISGNINCEEGGTLWCILTGKNAYKKITISQ